MVHKVAPHIPVFLQVRSKYVAEVDVPLNTHLALGINVAANDSAGFAQKNLE